MVALNVGEFPMRADFTPRKLDSARFVGKMGIPDDADQCSGHADHRFRDDGDHDSGMMPITRSGMMAIS